MTRVLRREMTRVRHRSLYITMERSTWQSQGFLSAAELDLADLFPVKFWKD